MNDDSAERQQTSQTIHLSQWFDRAIDSEWETAEQFVQAQHPELETHFRGGTDLKIGEGGVKRWKIIDLERAEEKVALLVGLEPKDRQEMDIEVEVCPSRGQTQLPQDLQVMILDEMGEMVMQAKAQQTHNLLFNFSGDLGKNFGVKLKIGEVIFVQSFLI